MIDTTLLIDLDEDPNGMRDVLVDLGSLGERLIVPAQAALEFAAGSRQPRAALRRLHEAFDVQPFTEPILAEAVLIARRAMDEGCFPGHGDIQIAATASYLGMAVATNNGRHFLPLGVDVLRYGHPGAE